MCYRFELKRDGRIQKTLQTARNEIMRTTQLTTAAAVVLALCLSGQLRAEEGYKASAEKESEQLAILRSDAPPADKALACKRLAIDGSSASVPDLAALLHDPQLASWARIALEVIPGEEADLALRTAAGSLDGILLVGTINSIGVRRDARATELLAGRLQDQNPEVAAAAAVALGRIGDGAATAALRRSLNASPMAVRSAVAEGCVLCAERLQAEGKSTEAAEIYDEVRKAELPKQRIVEATRGAILARNQQGVPLLLEQLRSQDEEMFEVALSTAREFPGAEIDRALAEELTKAAPERAALIVEAMADRPETVSLAAVLKAATAGPEVVRRAAIESLGRVGNASCLVALLDAAVDGNEELAQAAKGTLARISDREVDTQILALLPNAASSNSNDKKYPVLLQLVGQRRIEALPALLKALEHSDAAVRGAALTSLGQTVGPKDLSVLIVQVVSPKHAEDAEVAERALKAASVRMPDRDVCAGELVAALDQTKSVPIKGSLLKILGAVGGSKALAGIHATAKERNAELQDVSSRLLGEWMTEDAAPVLLDLAKSAPEEKYQVRALRGYLRIARQFVMPDEQRLAMCRSALEVSPASAEKKLVLDVLKRYPNPDGLKLAIDLISDKELQEPAAVAVLEIGQKLSGKGTDVKDLLAQANFGDLKLEITKAEYGADGNTKDVTSVLQEKSKGQPMIALDQGYNDCFGGDPVPGTAKQLKVQYAINGKPGEATFAEDAVIILPMPK
jgi:HEAT repeat protein